MQKCMEKAIVEGKMFTSIQTNNFTESRRGHEKKHSKEDFVCILGNLFLATGWLTIGMHYLQCVNSCTINTFKKHVSV